MNIIYQTNNVHEGFYSSSQYTLESLCSSFESLSISFFISYQNKVRYRFPIIGFSEDIIHKDSDALCLLKDHWKDMNQNTLFHLCFIEFSKETHEGYTFEQLLYVERYYKEKYPIYKDDIYVIIIYKNNNQT